MINYQIGNADLFDNMLFPDDCYAHQRTFKPTFWCYDLVKYAC